MKKNKTTMTIIIVSIIMILITFIIGNKKITPTINQTCLNNMKIIYPDYSITNEIVISWKDNITEETANQIINAYGLNMNNFKPWGTVISVPEGSVLEWSCILLEYESNYIKDVTPNYYKTDISNEEVKQ